MHSRKNNIENALFLENSWVLSDLKHVKTLKSARKPLFLG